MNTDKFIIIEIIDDFARAKNSVDKVVIIPNNYTCYEVGDEFSEKQFNRQQNRIEELKMTRDRQWRKLIELT